MDEDKWSMLRTEYDRITTARFRVAENTEVTQHRTASNRLVAGRLWDYTNVVRRYPRPRLYTASS
jgi:hypothetical protein